MRRKAPFRRFAVSSVIRISHRNCLVNSWIRALAEMQGVLVEFQQRDIQIKDLERGLIDFPAFMGDKEVFLCWEEGEEDVEFWHDLDAGYAGRSPL